MVENNSWGGAEVWFLHKCYFMQPQWWTAFQLHQSNWSNLAWGLPHLQSIVSAMPSTLSKCPTSIEFLIFTYFCYFLSSREVQYSDSTSWLLSLLSTFWKGLLSFRTAPSKYLTTKGCSSPWTYGTYNLEKPRDWPVLTEFLNPCHTAVEAKIKNDA